MTLVLSKAQVEELAEGITQKDKRAVSQALNWVEDKRPEAIETIRQILSAIKKKSVSHSVRKLGITGPPGVGKSSLTAALTETLRQKNQSVGIIAVDPSSMRSGGSLLGDRARMNFSPQDQNLFVRSLATGGDAGGLSYAANTGMQVLSAAFDWVIAETTGVGQTEADIVHVADTVVLVIQPGSGDTLQFLKAGIMEIPDILVVNKADHGAHAQRAVTDLKSAMHAIAQMNKAEEESWMTPVIATSAKEKTGLNELIDAVVLHQTSVGEKGLHARRLNGSVQWALSMFKKKHGEYGVHSLGGAFQLRKQATELAKKGASALEIVETLSTSYLRGAP